ncbi:MAG: flippase-like domain-containing protein [Chloroflexota bacterium]|nr:flippase-like domain-containing protein [Chloroflexota bacterium]
MRKIIAFVKAHPKQIFTATGVVFIAIAAYIFYREWDRISRVLTEADIGTLVVAGLLSVGSYGLFLVGFVFIHRLFGFDLPITRLGLIGYVSATINHLIPLASVGEYSLRVYFLKQQGYSVKDSVTVSVIHSFMHNSLLFVLFPAFAIYVLTSYQVGSTTSIILVISAIVSVVVLAVVAATIFHQESRKKVFAVLNKVFKALDLRITDEMHRLVDYFENAKSTLKQKAPMFGLLLAIIIAEWFVTAFILEYCFQAIGYDVPLPQLMVGFILAVSMGLFSLLPSGIGVQEGTMTLAFMALGAPFEYAFLAPILFRALYYFLPAALSLALYWLLLKDNQPEESMDLLGNDNEL